MNGMSAEASVLRNYLDTILDLPWTEVSETKPDLQTAASVLNADHYGLKKVKERILEYLAVQTLVDRMRGPILCLVRLLRWGKPLLLNRLRGQRIDPL